MLSKEERAASRAICDAATEGPWHEHDGYNFRDYPPEQYHVITKGMGDIIASWVKKEDAKFIAHARTALPAALDALDEMEERADAQTVRELARQAEFYNNGMKLLQADRDQWKARADAFEKAIKGTSFQVAPCVVCKIQSLNNENDKYKACNSCGYNYSNFIFNQERFSKEQSNE